MNDGHHSFVLMARVGLFLKNKFIVILKKWGKMQCKEQQLKAIKKIDKTKL